MVSQLTVFPHGGKEAAGIIASGVYILGVWHRIAQHCLLGFFEGPNHATCVISVIPWVLSSLYLRHQWRGPCHIDKCRQHDTWGMTGGQTSILCQSSKDFMAGSDTSTT